MSLTYLSPWQGQLEGAHVELEDFYRSLLQDNHTSYLVAHGSQRECSKMPLLKIQGFLAAEVPVYIWHILLAKQVDLSPSTAHSNCI